MTKKVSELPAITTLDPTDILMAVDLSAGAAGSSKITVANLAAALFSALGAGSVSWSVINKTGSSLADLTTRAATDLTITDDKLIAGVSGSATEIDCASYSRSLLAATTASAWRTLLDAVARSTYSTANCILATQGAIGTPAVVDWTDYSIMARNGSTIAPLAMSTGSVFIRLASGSLSSLVLATNTLLGRSGGDVAAIAVSDGSLFGRTVGGNAGSLTPTQARALLNVEDGADATDATNVDAAGAVMESDYTASSLLVADAAATPTPLTVAANSVVGRAGGAIANIAVAASRILGRTAAGAFGALTAAEVLTLIGVSSGANTISPLANDDSFIPQWNGVNTRTLKNGLQVRTSIRASGTADNLSVGTEAAVRAAIAAISAISKSGTMTANRLPYWQSDGVLTQTDYQYDDVALLDGSETWTGAWNAGGFLLNNLANPISNQDAATKYYVDQMAMGLYVVGDVDEIVADANATAPGDGLPAAAAGQRYILETNTASLHANWGTITGVGDGDIVEYDGADWVVSLDVSALTAVPYCWDIDTERFMQYSSGEWVRFGGLQSVVAGVGLQKLNGVMDILLGAGMAVDGSNQLTLAELATVTNTLYVDATIGDDGNDGSLTKPFETVKAAVDSLGAVTNTLILVGAGVDASAGTITVGDGISIRGCGVGITEIGQSIEMGDGTLSDVTCIDVTLDGGRMERCSTQDVTLTDDSVIDSCDIISTGAYAVNVGAESAVISDCNITSTGAHGVYVAGGAARVHDCYINSNLYDGVYVDGSGSVVLNDVEMPMVATGVTLDTTTACKVDNLLAATLVTVAGGTLYCGYTTATISGDATINFQSASTISYTHADVPAATTAAGALDAILEDKLDVQGTVALSTGVNTVDSFDDTEPIPGLMWQYVIYDDSGVGASRTGLVAASWKTDGSEVQYNELNNTGIGDTSDVTLSVVYDSSSSTFQLRATDAGSGHSISFRRIRMYGV